VRHVSFAQITCSLMHQVNGLSLYESSYCRVRHFMKGHKFFFPILSFHFFFSCTHSLQHIFCLFSRFLYLCVYPFIFLLIWGLWQFFAEFPLNLKYNLTLLGSTPKVFLQAGCLTVFSLASELEKKEYVTCVYTFPS